MAKTASEIEADVGSLSPAEVARRGFNSHQSALNSRVDRYLRGIEGKLDALRATWREKAAEDRGAYYKACRPLIEDDTEPGGLVRVLNLLEMYRGDLEEGFAGRYEGFLRTLEQLEEGIDLEGAFAVVEDDRTALEDRIRDLNAVAQVGITVEIVGHELETLDAEVRRNLLRLPEDVRRSSAFKQAFEAHSALTERLRFLSPLKVAGYRSRETITGMQIARYVEEFFGRAFRDGRITFTASDAFRSIRIVDLPSRIYPVFINLVNNAVYWVGQAVDRRIAFDFQDGLVVVADSGRGIDEDDVPRLFELFFTRRREGRGVGLYLSQVNLAVANHKIRHAGPEDPKVLPGANFIIEFRGVSADA